MSISDFETVSKLGDGAFSSVFKVMRKSDGQSYALKKVKLGALKQKEKENALNEVRILASVSHPNIIAYKEAFIDEPTNTLCIVMELAESGDLLKKISNHKAARTFFPENEVWMTLVQVTQGLKVLHDSKILHRDLKCANIFISKDGTMKLGDLNVSKVNKRGLAYTQTGTPYYASPEVWKDQPYNSSSDIWSLGCVIYEMAALVPPFTASDMQGLYKKIIRGIYPNIPNQYSTDLSNVIRTLLQVNPTLRPTCEKILEIPPVQRHINIQLIPNPQTADLLGTIKFEPGFKNMKQKLPGPNYDSRNRGLSAHSNRPKIEEGPPARLASARGREPYGQVDGSKPVPQHYGPKYEIHQAPKAGAYDYKPKENSRYQRPENNEIVNRKDSDPNIKKKPELFNIPETKNYTPYVAPYRPERYAQLYNEISSKPEIPVAKNPSRENIYQAKPSSRENLYNPKPPSRENGYNAKPPSRENLYQPKPDSRENLGIYKPPSKEALNPYKPSREIISNYKPPSAENLNYVNSPNKPVYPSKPASRENPSAYQYINKPSQRDNKIAPPYIPSTPYFQPKDNRAPYVPTKDNKIGPSYIQQREAPLSRENRGAPSYNLQRDVPNSREGRPASREDPNKNLNRIGALVLQSPKQLLPKGLPSPQERNQPIKASYPDKRQIKPVWWG